MKFKIYEIVGCNGEGNALYKIIAFDQDNVYLEAFGNTNIDAGWERVSQLRKVKSFNRKVAYDVEFE